MTSDIIELTFNLTFTHFLFVKRNWILSRSSTLGSASFLETIETWVGRYFSKLTPSFHLSTCPSRFSVSNSRRARVLTPRNLGVQNSIMRGGFLTRESSSRFRLCKIQKFESGNSECENGEAKTGKWEGEKRPNFQTRGLIFTPRAELEPLEL